MNKKEQVVTITDNTEPFWQQSLTVKPKYYANKQKEFREKQENTWIKIKHEIQNQDVLSKYLN